MAKFVLYTDGGKKGEEVSWSFVCHANNKPEKFIHRYDLVDHHKLTSQTAEMTAIIKALEFVYKELCQDNPFEAQNVSLHVISDSEYCVKGATTWMHNWKKTDWIDKQNVDLWKRIYALTVNTFKAVHYEWVRGHNGTKFNELADLGCNVALGRLTIEQAMLKWEKYS